MNGRTLTSLVATVVAGGVVAAGCSTGGGGGGKASIGVGITPVQSGTLVEGLPAPQLDANGYDFSLVSVNQVPGGTVPALTTASVNTAVYAANFPGGSVLLVDDLSVNLSGNLFYEARSMAADGANVFAATANRSRDGAGDLYAAASGGTWQIAIDSSDAEMTVGAGSLGVFAAHGGAGREGALRQLVSGQWQSIASLQSAVPTAIAESDGRLFVGGSDAFGGYARLLRYEPSTGALANVPLPGAGGGFGVRQEVTSMVSIATVASGSIMPIATQVLVVAVGSFDSVGNGVGGMVLATDGARRFETIASFAGDAPVAVIFQDASIVVATSRGRLYHRDAQGRMVEETLPASAGITGFASGLSRDQASAVFGGKTAAGAVLVRRVARGGGYVPPATDLYYRPDAKAILQNRCASCHGVGSAIPAATMAMTLDFDQADDQATHATVLTKLDLNAPQASLLLQKATGTGHVGGTVITTGSPDYNNLVAWVQQGARFEATAAPTGPTYVTDIRPILQDCLSCHRTATNFNLSNNLSLNNQDYMEVLTFVNTTNPETSQILRKPTNTATGGHGGGVRFTTGSTPYNTIVQWIQQGTRFQ